MKIYLLNDNVPVKQMHTLTSVAPAVFTIHGEDEVHAEKLRSELRTALLSFPAIKVPELGVATGFISALHAGHNQFEVALFGGYLPAFMDMQEWMHREHPEVKFSAYINDDSSCGEIDSIYYEDTESLHVDAFRFSARSTEKIWNAVSLCHAWHYEDGIYDAGSSIISTVMTPQLLKKYGVLREDMFNPKCWEHPEVSVPAVFLFVCLNEVLVHALVECAHDESGHVHVAIDSDCCIEDYKRDLVLELFVMVDEKLATHKCIEDIDWQGMYCQYKSKVEAQG